MIEAKKQGPPTLKTKVIIHVRQCMYNFEEKKPTKTIPIFFFAAADPNFNKQKMVLLNVRHCCKTYTHKKFVNILRLEFPHALTWISIKNCAAMPFASWMNTGWVPFLSIKNVKKICFDPPPLFELLTWLHCPWHSGPKKGKLVAEFQCFFLFF